MPKVRGKLQRVFDVKKYSLEEEAFLMDPLKTINVD